MQTPAEKHKAQASRYAGIAKRAATIKALAIENTPEARKARKAMNTQYHSEGRSTLGTAWQPNGSKAARGKDKSARINKALKARNH
jgi:hypothetical protein